jgi:osmotically-inducible protein OsmY
MSRIPHAATSLIAEVQAKRKSAKYETVGDPDGLDTVRTIAFDKATTKALEDALTASLEVDERVAELHTKDGKLHVTFVPGIAADYTQPFNIGEADDVLSE